MPPFQIVSGMIDIVNDYFESYFLSHLQRVDTMEINKTIGAANRHSPTHTYKIEIRLKQMYTHAQHVRCLILVLECYGKL